MSVASVVMGSGLGSPFLKMRQILKLFNRLRYINTNFGRILTQFMTSTGSMVKDVSPNPDDVIKYSRNFSGKMSKYRIILVFWNSFNWKICLYLISWILKLYVNKLV